MVGICIGRRLMPCIMKFLKIHIMRAIIMGCLFMPLFAQAKTSSDGTPLLLNLYLDWNIQESDIPHLAKWDVLVLDADQQARYPAYIRKIRELHPQIKILAYLPSQEISLARFSEPAHYPFAKLAARMEDVWYAKKTTGEIASFWPGSLLVDVTDLGIPGMHGQRWNDVLPLFIRDEILSTGLWDGVFLDNTFDGISYFVSEPLDLNRDGNIDEKIKNDNAWKEGMTKMLRRMHELMPHAIIMGNGGFSYASELDGVMFEKFPSTKWSTDWKRYIEASTKTRQPTFTAINVNMSNVHRPESYQAMRFGLASAIMGDGYYSFDQGDQNHHVLWWYDEYDVKLGAPRFAPRSVRATQEKQSLSAVWLQEYEKGLVILNSTTKPQFITLPGVFETIRGVQDVSINSGSLVHTVTLASKDAIFLQRRIDAKEIRGAAFLNGSFVRSYTVQGNIRRNGFFATREDAPTGAMILSEDIDRDGQEDLLTAAAGKVNISFGNGKNKTFQPFPGYSGALSVAIGNTNRDASLEIILARAISGPPEVSIFSSSGKRMTTWLAYDRSFSGGVSVAIGALFANGQRQIVTGAGPSGGPHIRVWNMFGTAIEKEFFAFDASEIGGVSVAVSDVTNDGRDEILVGSGQGAIPRIRIFSSKGQRIREITLADSPLLRGLYVFTSDADDDGVKEIYASGISAF